ncbi:MAG TPA: hypothetical protein HA263_07055 [Methanoregulaceae archaeon]|nr:hypothetical protein [Methanoregulaceae archaeon]
MMPPSRELIKEMQCAVLRRCAERIERTGRTSVGHYREAGRKEADRGVTGGVRSRHGL